MPLTDSIPTIVGSAVLKALEKRLVYRNLFNTDYAGEVTYGSKVKIVSRGGNVNIGDYTKESAISYEYVSDSSQDMPIDQQKYFAVAIDDIDSVQEKPDMFAAYVENAVYGMTDVMDQYLAGLLENGGTITADLGNDTTPLEINSGNISETLIHMARLLDDAKVPRAGRMAVLPPWAVEDLVISKIIDATNNGAEMNDAMVGRFAGFNLLVSHNVPNSAGDKFKIVAGSSIAATMAMQIEKTEQIRLPDTFADGIRGLTVYGGKVIRPGALAVATWNEAAES